MYIMDRPLLSICIPTRNRCRYLVKNILSIVNQKPFQEGKVEVIVANNASDDDTDKEIQTLRKKYNIKYIKHTQNIGSEVNFRTIIQEANGELIKLVNDSFMFKENSLESIIDIVEANSKARPYIYFTNRDDIDRTYNFYDFLYNETYEITALITLSIWNEDKFLVGNDDSCDNNNLWCTNTNLKLSKSKDCILECNNKYFINQNLDVKYFDYSLFKVFYNKFLDLTNKYLEDFEFAVRQKCMEKIKKDLYFKFFKHWVYIYDTRNDVDSQYRFLTEENLHKEVFESCKEKKYYLLWVFKYYLFFVAKRIKHLVFK